MKVRSLGLLKDSFRGSTRVPRVQGFGFIKAFRFLALRSKSLGSVCSVFEAVEGQG